MTKKRALQIIDELFSCYKSEFEGTSDYNKNHKEIEKAVEYVKNKLN